MIFMMKQATLCIALREEVLQIQTVDFKKYADIIVNLQMKNEYYWLVKYFDDRVLEHARNNIDKDSVNEIIVVYNRLNTEAFRLRKEGTPPESEAGQKFAEEFWGMIMKFTGGDMSLLPALLEAGNDKKIVTENNANDFIGLSLETYLSKLSVNPFAEVSE